MTPGNHSKPDFATASNILIQGQTKIALSVVLDPITKLRTISRNGQNVKSRAASDNEVINCMNCQADGANVDENIIDHQSIHAILLDTGDASMVHIGQTIGYSIHNDFTVNRVVLHSKKWCVLQVLP